MMPLKPLKLGLYQPWTANMDEGWTRFIFDKWEFPYTILHDAQIQRGDLRQDYDVIVLTNVTSNSIVTGRKPGTVPAQYAGGVGSQGVTALHDFVRNGGTLIALNAACEFCIEHLNVPLRSIAGSYASTEFYCPSAILQTDVDATHPIAYGMGKTAAILFFQSPVLDISESAETPSAPATLPTARVIARYPKRNPFLSGRLIGDEVLHAKPALVEVPHGKGRIILFGFRPQNRAQTHGTFMLFFNSLYYGPAQRD
jgi:hypothetical protein